MSTPSFFIQPLLYDPVLRCASFDVYLGEKVSRSTKNLDIAPLFEHYPGLRKHRCDSPVSRNFYDEARQTDIVHLLEHLTLELFALSISTTTKDCCGIRGQTGIPYKKGHTPDRKAPYRVRFFGANSLEEMDKLIRQGVELLHDLVLVETEETYGHSV